MYSTFFDFFLNSYLLFISYNVIIYTYMVANTEHSLPSNHSPAHVDIWASFVEGQARPDLDLLEKNTPELPNQIDLVLAETALPEVDFITAQKTWFESFNVDQLTQALEAQSSILDSRQELNSYYAVKTLRNKANVLIAAWIFFDTSHTAPNCLQQLAKLLGKIKDEKVSLKRKRKLIGKAAKTVKHFEREYRHADFQPCNTASLLNHYQEILLKITNLTQKQSMSQAEYHEVRKHFRMINKLFGLIAMRLPDSDAAQIQAFLHLISGRMGETQDTFVEQQQTGVDKHAAMVAIEPVHRDNIQTFLQKQSNADHLLTTNVQYPTISAPDELSDNFLPDTYQPQTLFFRAFQDWQTAFDAESITTASIRLLEGSLSKTERETLVKQLKQIRKVGNRFESIWKLVNTAIPFPKSFSLLLSSLGKVKDAHKKTQQLPKLVHQLLKRIEQFQAEGLENPPFIPATVPEFLSEYTNILTYCREMSNQPTWSALEHHRVRWRLRRITHYYYFLSQVHPNPIAFHLLSLLDGVTSSMGDEQAQIQKREKQEQNSKSEMQIYVHPELRKSLQTIVNLHLTGSKTNEIV